MKFTFLLFIFLLITDSCHSATLSGATLSGARIVNRKILCLGDSITEGDVSGDPYWRNNLQDLLGIGFYDFVGDRRSPTSSSFWGYDMEHAGIGGQQTAVIKGRVPALLTNYFTEGTDFSHSFVLLHAGTNDCFQYACEVSTTALDNIEDMVDLIMAHNPQLRVIVALIIPSDKAAPDEYQNGRIQNFIPLLDTRLQSLQATYPGRIIIADMNSEFLNTSNCNPDIAACLDSSFGVHPNTTGQAVMAAQWKRCIDSPANQGCNGN